MADIFTTGITVSPIQTTPPGAAEIKRTQENTSPWSTGSVRDTAGQSQEESSRPALENVVAVSEDGDTLQVSNAAEDEIEEAASGSVEETTPEPPRPVRTAAEENFMTEAPAEPPAKPEVAPSAPETIVTEVDSGISSPDAFAAHIYIPDNAVAMPSPPPTAADSSVASLNSSPAADSSAASGTLTSENFASEEAASLSLNDAVQAEALTPPASNSSAEAETSNRADSSAVETARTASIPDSGRETAAQTIQKPRESAADIISEQIERDAAASERRKELAREQTQSVTTSGGDTVSTQITSFAGVSNQQLEQLYRDGRISRHDYESEISSREERLEELIQSSEKSSRQTIRADQIHKSVERTGEAIRNAYEKESSTATTPQTRLNAMENIELAPQQRAAQESADLNVAIN